MDEQNIFIDIDEIDEIKPKKSRKKRKKETPRNEVPSVQRAWKVGYSAAQANLPETRNPFIDTASEEFKAWLEGWWSGFYDEPLHIGLGTFN